MKSIKYFVLLGLLFSLQVSNAQVDSVAWDFAVGTAAPATDVTWAHYSCTPLTTSAGGEPTVNGSSPSSGYAGASKGNNLAIACPAAGTYIQWTMEPDVAKEVALSYIEFGARSTSTGAKRWSLLSSKDGYAAAIATGTMAASSTWTLQKSAVNFEGGVGKTVTFRLFFDNANVTGTPSLNTRIDDVKIRTKKSAAEPKIRLNTRRLSFTTALGVSNAEAFTVKGLQLSESISVTAVGNNFSVNKSSVSAADANAGAQQVEVTFDGAANATGKVVLKTTAAGLTLSDTVQLAGATTTNAYIAVSVPSAADFYLEYPPVLVGSLNTQMVKMSGRSLTDSIRVVLPSNSAFTASALALPKNVSSEGDGYIMLYYRPTQEEVVRDTLVLQSRNVADVRIPIRAQAVRERTDWLPPENYYLRAEQKTGAALKTALYNIVKNHTIVQYFDAWTAFSWLDMRPECDLYFTEGSVWDIYTDRPGCTPSNSRCIPSVPYAEGNRCADFKVLRMGLDQTGSAGGSTEGVSYEREHTFPKGWWAAAKGSSGYRETSPMYNDLFHLYPCDHRVNNLRNDNPFGEVKNPSTTFTNGSKLGPNTAGGTYTGTAYEPIDEYKGDLARNYFYMVTRYENTVQHWSKNITWGGAEYDTVIQILPGLHGNASPMIDTNSYPVFQPWAHQMLLRWHRLDPVSEKERARNQTIYEKFQHNRNPYIDHPALVEYIWGDSIGRAWNSAVVIEDDTSGKDTAVVVKPAVSDTIQVAACDSYAHNDSLYTQSGTYTQHFTSAAGGDSTLVIQLAISKSTAYEVSKIGCDSLVVNSIVYRESGTYTQHLRNAAGCDSALTLRLTVKNCDTIPDTIPSIVDTIIDTIDTVTAVGKVSQPEFSLYPNPNTGEFSIALPSGEAPIKVEVFSLQGVEYQCVEMGSGRYRVSAPSGLYLVRITTSRGVGARKFTLAP